MENEKDIKKINDKPSIFEDTNIKGDDAFMAITLAFLREPFLSSSIKELCIYKAIGYLEDLNYSKKDIEIFKEKMNKVIKEIMPVNDFMG